MSILSGHEIEALIYQGFVQNANKGDIGQCQDVNAASLDLHLGPNFKVVKPEPMTIRADKQTNPKFEDFKGSVRLNSGDCVLAETREIFNLPEDISASVYLRSSIGRKFLNHMLAGWCDAGWHGSCLTLEFTNNLPEPYEWELREGDRLVQMVFHRHKHAGAYSYRNKGSYNNSTQVQEAN